jgi:molecular chaperone DnaK
MTNPLCKLVPSLQNHKRISALCSENLYVGIDFGTSNTVVSICTWDEARGAIVTEELRLDRNATGEPTHLIPSVIYLDGSDLLIGQMAKIRGDLVGIAKRNYLRSFKMELGYGDGTQYHQFELAQEAGKISDTLAFLDRLRGRAGEKLGERFRIDSAGKATQAFFMLLKKFIDDHCERRFPGRKPKFSVSIPACFGSNQRREYRMALEGAGIQIAESSFIDEPNAAFLSWLAQDSASESRMFQSETIDCNVLVFDFGAGTCDLSILNLKKEGQGHRLKLKNLALSRFSALGGDDLDRYLAFNYLFPRLCKENGIDPGSITSPVYRNHLEVPLMSLAEKLKIRASQRLSRENVPKKAEITVQLDSPVKIELPPNWVRQLVGGSGTCIIIPDEFKIEMGEFTESIENFISGEGEDRAPKDKSLAQVFRRLLHLKSAENHNICSLISDVLGKSSIGNNDVDYVLFIGGSSNLRTVQEAVLEYFDDEPEAIIADDLQSHVSKGVALHALLSQGINENPLTEILAEGIYLMVKNGEREVFKSGTEIPARVKLGKLHKNRKSQRMVEMPFLAGDERRLITKITTKFPPGLSVEDEITLEAYVDPHKIVHLECRYGGGSLMEGEEISPFAKEALDEYSKRIANLRSDFHFVLLAENFKTGSDSLYGDSHRFVRSEEIFLEMIELYESHNNHVSCLALYEEFAPDNYVALNFHASHARERQLSEYYEKKAYEENPCGVTAYNLALSKQQGSQEYCELMEEAILQGDLTARVVFATYLKSRNPERADHLMADAAAHYRKRFADDPDDIQRWEYFAVNSIADYYGDLNLQKEIDSALSRRQRELVSQKREVKEGNLLESAGDEPRGTGPFSFEVKL